MRYIFLRGCPICRSMRFPLFHLKQVMLFHSTIIYTTSSSRLDQETPNPFQAAQSSTDSIYIPTVSLPVFFYSVQLLQPFFYKMRSHQFIIFVSLVTTLVIRLATSASVPVMRSQTSKTFSLVALSRNELSGTVTCSSERSRPALCAIPGVPTSLVVQTKMSNKPCTAGTSFFTYPGAVLVLNGCRATFKYTSFQSSFPFKTVLCQSSNSQTTTCAVGAQVDSVRLFKQLSSASCNKNTFGS